MTVALDHKHTIEGKGTREQSITTGQRSMIPTEQATSTEGGRLSKAEQVRETALMGLQTLRLTTRESLAQRSPVHGREGELSEETVSNVWG